MNGTADADVGNLAGQARLAEVRKGDIQSPLPAARCEQTLQPGRRLADQVRTLQHAFGEKQLSKAFGAFADEQQIFGGGPPIGVRLGAFQNAAVRPYLAISVAMGLVVVA